MDSQKVFTYIKHSSYNFKFNSLIILIISIIILIILPFIIINFNHNPYIPDVIKSSNLAQSLYNNITLRIVYYSSIFTTIPIIIDMILDILTLKIIKKISLFDQLYLLLLLIIPNIIYLLVEKLEIFPILYWIILTIQYNMMIHIVVTYFVTYSPFKCMPLSAYYIGMICIYLSNIFSTSTLLITSSKIQYIMSILTILFFCIASLILIITIIRWCKYYIYDTKIDSDYKYYDEWFISSIYLFAIFLLFILSILANSISSFQYPYDMNEYSCMVYNINVALFVAILSIVPGKYLYFNNKY